MADGTAAIQAYISGHHRQCVRALQMIVAMADCESEVHRNFVEPYLRYGDRPSGWRIAEKMAEIANDCIGTEGVLQACGEDADEPAWLTRLSKGNVAMSPFVAAEIASQVRELLVYRRAIEAMAAQFVCPKTTPQELAKQILKKGM